MTHLPRFGAGARTAIGRTAHLGRMLGMHHGEHLLVAEEAIVILLGLGVETGIVVRIPGGRTRRRAHHVLVEPPPAPGPVSPRPVVVATIRIRVAIADETVAPLGGG